MPEGRPLPDHVVSLLTVLAAPDAARALALEQWDLLVRVSRGARLAAALGARVPPDAVPERVAGALASEQAVVDHQNQMVRLELHELARALAPLDVPVVLLKGAAYLLADKAWARGRLLGDVDILVPRARLEAVERALLDKGWESEVTDAYDRRYYVEWSHELPPLRRPGAALELDVHHSILPVTGRVRPDAAALLEASVALPGTPFRVLCREDQVLHAAVHLFQDSDCAGRLRDLVDLDGLLRELGDDAAAWGTLVARARLHGVTRPLWYALRFTQALLGTPAPASARAALDGAAPPAPVRALMDRLVPRALLPAHPDRLPPWRAGLAQFLLYVRSLWLRMPPGLLATHLARKGWRRVAPARRDVTPLDRAEAE
jgi:hypothetical protein